MSKLSEALHIKGGFANQTSSPLLSMTKGGMHGWANHLRDFRNNAAYVTRQTVCQVLETPRGFDYLDDPKVYIDTFKYLMETASVTITGLTEGLTVDTDDHLASGGGMRQQEPINVTREQSQVSHSFIERGNRTIGLFLDTWIRYLIMDPDTKHPLISIVGAPGLVDFGPDLYSATVLYYEPDALFKTCTRAWLFVNVFPLTTGAETATRDLASGQSILTLDVSFAGMAQTGPGVRRFAEKMMAISRTTHSDPQFRMAIMDHISTRTKAGDNKSPYDHTFADPATKERDVTIPPVGAGRSTAMPNN